MVLLQIMDSLKNDSNDLINYYYDLIDDLLLLFCGNP